MGLLALVTVGIYGLYWYFRTNSDLKAFGEAKHDPGLDVRPGVATVAVAFSYLVIVPNLLIDDDAISYSLAGAAALPFLVSWFRTLRRIRRAQEIEGLERRLPVWLLFVLAILVAGPIPPLPSAIELVWTVISLFSVFLLYRECQRHLNGVWSRYIGGQ